METHGHTKAIIDKMDTLQTVAIVEETYEVENSQVEEQSAVVPV